MKKSQTIFYNLLVNTIIATITNFTVWFALTYFVYLQTQSVLSTSILAGFYLIVTAFSGFWLGSIVDHHKKKTTMIGSSAASLVIYIVGFILYQIVPADTFQQIENPVLWAFALLLLSGVLAGNLRNIALSTTVTILFPPDKRDKANGLIGSASGVAFLIVSVISGVLVAWGGMFYALIIPIVLTSIVIIHLLFIEIPENGIAHLPHEEDAADGKKIDIRGTLKTIRRVPGLFSLLLFATFNNFLGGVFMSLMDPYGLSLVSVETWGFLWGFLSLGFLVGGGVIAKFGLGQNPLRTLFLANIVLWIICALFAIQASIILLTVGMFFYMSLVPFLEACEQTIIQKVVPKERQGRVFGFAQSLEQSASPLTAFFIGPIAQFIFMPFMTTGAGVDLIGSWFGTGPDRGMALIFTLTGIAGLCVTLLVMRSRFYTTLSQQYLTK